MMSSSVSATVCLVLVSFSLISGARVRFPRHRVKSEVLHMMEPTSANQWLMYEPLPPPTTDVQLPWRKRAGSESPSSSTGTELAESVVQAGKNLANQFMLRSSRGSRPRFDVPQIGEYFSLEFVKFKDLLQWHYHIFRHFIFTI